MMTIITILLRYLVSASAIILTYCAGTNNPLSLREGAGGGLDSRSTTVSVAVDNSPITLIDPPPPDNPDAPPVGTPRPGSTRDIRTADDLLAALEAADQGIRDLTASVRYTKENSLLGDIQIRRGKLFFRVVPDTTNPDSPGTAPDPATPLLPLRQFAVNFISLQIGDEIENQSRDYIFDGRYLVERLNAERQFFKREVVGAGETFDPLSIDGPFPLPIGQRRAQMFARFEATLILPDKDVPDADARLKGHYHLHLVARDRNPDSEELDTVDLWYDPTTLLPSKVIVFESNGDTSTIELATVERNPESPVDPNLFSTATPPTSDGWRIEITPLHVEPKR